MPSYHEINEEPREPPTGSAEESWCIAGGVSYFSNISPASSGFLRGVTEYFDDDLA
jgi:hypothetical protein